MSRSVNMILLGAASHALGLDIATLSESVARVFGKKGEDIVNMNVKALELGAKCSQ